MLGMVQNVYTVLCCAVLGKIWGCAVLGMVQNGYTVLCCARQDMGICCAVLGMVQECLSGAVLY